MYNSYLFYIFIKHTKIIHNFPTSYKLYIIFPSETFEESNYCIEGIYLPTKEKQPNYFFKLQKLFFDCEEMQFFLIRGNFLWAKDTFLLSGRNLMQRLCNLFGRSVSDLIINNLGLSIPLINVFLVKIVGECLYCKKNINFT